MTHIILINKNLITKNILTPALGILDIALGLWFYSTLPTGLYLSNQVLNDLIPYFSYFFALSYILGGVFAQFEKYSKLFHTTYLVSAPFRLLFNHSVLWFTLEIGIFTSSNNPLGYLYYWGLFEIARLLFSLNKLRSL